MPARQRWGCAYPGVETDALGVVVVKGVMGGVVPQLPDPVAPVKGAMVDYDNPVEPVGNGVVKQHDLQATWNDVAQGSLLPQQ